MMIAQKVAPCAMHRFQDERVDERRETITISVILPVAEEETAGIELVRDLAGESSHSLELVVAATDPQHPLMDQAARTFEGRVQQIASPPGRAIQMNTGARAASGNHFWFLHADSRLPPGAVEHLKQAIETAPDALHFFGLCFHDGPAALWLNALGTEVRSRILGIPFGDQGFCIRREWFFDLGGFDESVTCGEDHHLVWMARRRGLPIRRVEGTISTSGRKYSQRGWVRTTLRHLRLTLRQAAGELMRCWSRTR